MSDYIDREAALLEIEEWADTFCECDYVWPNVIKSIKELPAADVQPVKRGTWKKENRYTLLCSQCGAYLWNNVNVIWNYCPQCGADMRISSTNCKNSATTGEDREISNLRAWLKNGRE